MASRDNKRALKTIRTLRRRQQKQTDQINMLCRDMVSAHREFSIKLSTLTFVASFYEALLQCAGLTEVIDTAIQEIRGAVAETDAVVFLLSEDGFEVHAADAGVSDSVEKRQFRHWFTRELVNRVSQMNRVCSMEQLLRMGLQGPPAIMKTISLAAIPLGGLGQGIGFVLVYRPAHLPFQGENLSRLAAINTGLFKAINSFQKAASVNSVRP